MKETMEEKLDRAIEASLDALTHRLEDDIFLVSDCHGIGVFFDAVCRRVEQKGEDHSTAAWLAHVAEHVAEDTEKMMRQSDPPIPFSDLGGVDHE